MKTKTMSALLRAVLLAAGLLLVVFFFLFLPFYGQDTVRYAPEFAWAYWPCLIWAWAFAVPIFWAMVPAWRVCGSIAVKGMAFTGKNARDLRTVSRLAFADAVIFPAGMLIVAYLGAGSAPLTFLITPLVTFFCLAAGIVLYVLSRLVADAAALREVEAARKRGQRVYVETCPQYLLLDDSVYDDPDYSRAARYVCAPPIRKTEDQRVLWAALRKGEIQTVSTDHCSFTLEQKDAGRGDFTRIPGGLPGVETRGELLYTYGVTTRKISLATMCRVLSENPAKLYGMFPRKGVLQAGADADIVVYDPQADHLLRAEDMTSLAGYTPYEGFPIRGGIRQVWLRGRLAVEDGFVLAGPDGKYISRGKCSL